MREDVRQRVLDVIRKTGYQPHAAARTLASRHSGTIGLVLPQSVSFFFTDPYYPHLIKGIAQACNEHNYTLALFPGGDQGRRGEDLSPPIRPGFVDGVIAQSGHHGEQWIIGRFVDAKTPLVIAGRPFRSDNVSYVDIDNVNAASSAVSHLLRLGRQRIALIGGPSTSTVGIDRKEGYRKALTQRGGQVESR